MKVAVCVRGWERSHALKGFVAWLCLNVAETVSPGSCKILLKPKWPPFTRPRPNWTRRRGDCTRAPISHATSGFPAACHRPLPGGISRKRSTIRTTACEMTHIKTQTYYRLGVLVWSQKGVKRRKIRRAKIVVKRATGRTRRDHDLHAPPNFPLSCKSAQAGVRIARLWALGDVARERHTQV